jgi:hypothetical protein
MVHFEGISVQFNTFKQNYQIAASSLSKAEIQPRVALLMTPEEAWQWLWYFCPAP